MQGKTIEERLERVRELLREIHHVPISTVNEDGSPHLSPVFMAFDEHMNAYWASHPDSQHSRNIARTGQVFLVVFDSREGHGGLYIKAEAHMLEQPVEAEKALVILTKLKEKVYGGMGGIEQYIGAGQDRLFCAKPVKLWMSNNERNEQGIIVRDFRHEITLQDLRG
jgi:uncharacterized pyridoxamine 5'-phosphate oxidase family protein